MAKQAKHRHVPSSPSISMEKGSYQIQRQPEYPPTLRNGKLQGRARRFSANEQRLACLIVLLVLAVILCFGTAYYLFETRWDEPRVQSGRATSDEPLQPYQVLEFERDLGPIPNDSSTKYLAYLAHSGFHNQRIALENALVLARLLNRTLLVPPIRLGKGTLPYYSFQHLYNLTRLMRKDGLTHCTDVLSWKALPVECTDYYDYTLIPWNWLTNITAISTTQPLIQRWNMSDTWLEDVLGITSNDTFIVKDTHAYQYRFIDTEPLDMPNSRFDEMISVSMLNQLPQRLVQVGTLFGSSRLRLRIKSNRHLRKEIRRNMVFTNEILVQLADTIKQKMSGNYVAVHLRLADGDFKRKAAKNVRSIWWNLLRDVLGFDDDEIINLERHFANPEVSSPESLGDQKLYRAPFPPLNISHSVRQHNIQCRSPLHYFSDFEIFNTPLFISTDVYDPASHVLLQRFFKLFPCTFVLSDFSAETAALHRFKSGYDGLILAEFIVPFLDAIVAGKARRVIGTEGSTFSQFVQDVLWRQYHGSDIVERG